MRSGWAGAALISILLSSEVASAYVRTRRKSDHLPAAWDHTRLEFSLARRTLPPRLPPASAEQALRAALKAWGSESIPCTALELVLTDDEDPQPSIGRDGVNRIVFRGDRWCRNGEDSLTDCYSSQEMAVTSVYVDKTGRAGPGATIVEADIEFNAVDYGWVVAPTPTTGNLREVSSVLLHEIGHAIGLEHNCNDLLDPALDLPSCRKADAGIRNATMFPSWVGRGSADSGVGPDEQRAVCDIYPLGAPIPSSSSSGEPPDGTSSLKPGKPSPALGKASLQALDGQWPLRLTIWVGLALAGSMLGWRLRNGLACALRRSRSNR